MKKITKLGIGITAIIGTVIGLKECKLFRTYEIPKGGCEIVYDCGKICYNGLLEDRRWFDASVDGEILPYGIEEREMQAGECWLKILSVDEEKLVLER